MSKPRIAVVFGSDSDWPVMEKCVQQLRALDEAPHVEVMSAHRGPDRVREFATSAEKDGYSVIIAAAGLSNALAGAVAAHTALPVIGVPLSGGSLNGMDALLSTVQMPPGMPVATVGIDAAKNAALLAVQIVARHDQELAARFASFRSEQSAAVAKRNEKLQDKLH